MERLAGLKRHGHVSAPVTRGARGVYTATSRVTRLTLSLLEIAVIQSTEPTPPTYYGVSEQTPRPPERITRVR
jgi:hypothetical protein